MVIGNATAEWRSHAENIQLVALCKQSDLKRSQLISTVVTDLKQLETEGVQVSGGKTVKGSLCFVCGDNLESHGLGEFIENFSSAIYFCRFCLITRALFWSDDRFKSSPRRRKPVNYEICVNVCQTRGLTDYQGVEGNSELNKLDYFHVTKGLPPCLAHDLHEGVVRHDLALLIKAMVTRPLGWFAIDFLNRRIEKFPYSTEERRDKPCRLPPKLDKIPGKACQVWAFIRLLPLIIGDKVDHDHDVWYCVMLLRQIVLLSSAVALNVNMLMYLGSVIREYIELRVKLFPEKPLRPKHHYLDHYCALIVEFGPLIRVWTLRFESKHMFFKRVSKFTGNYINILKTLSEKHELHQSYLRSGARQRNNLIPYQESRFDVNLYAQEIREAIASVNAVSPLVECSRVQYKGTMYRQECAVVMPEKSLLWDLKFGIIKRIFHDANQTVFFLVHLQNSEYDSSLQAYSLGDLVGFRCLSVQNLGDYRPLHVYSVNYDKYVVLKHAVLSESS